MPMTSPRTPKRLPVPRGFVFAALLVAVVEAGIGANPRLFRTAEGWVWRLSERDSRVTPRGPVFLFFGDSLILHGIAPEVIEQRTDTPARNFGIPGGQPIASHVLFRKAIEAGARPRAVVIGA